MDWYDVYAIQPHCIELLYFGLEAKNFSSKQSPRSKVDDGYFKNLGDSIQMILRPKLI